MIGTLWLVIKVVLGLVVCLLIIKELLTFYYVSQHKASQSCDKMYFPFLGIVPYHFWHTKKYQGKLTWLFKRISDHQEKGKKWILTNTPFHLKPLTIITDPQLISQYFIKEMEISVRKDTQPQPPVLDIGFFYQYGTRAT